ncbi:sensor histidine kinase [Lapillicoccus jejuensis]|uniref:Histidine kinase n=1 Tax=Lapillicoccus jejuensis TaxID=402171 RepID=A0A542DV91_9MICO|nr:histidine kinase [Lapillicoccus jejuensis]TQJ06988.1 histidine kinase [Lapillicoccus jejuensis]
MPGGSGPPLALVVGLRPGELTLGADDERVLRLTVPLLALTLEAQSQRGQLQEARAATAAALEDERRRLRRDLHDGLGPQLSGIAFAADAVDNLLDVDAPAARELVRGLRQDAAEAVGDVRRIVYGMRPPALDELGLVEALRQRARGLVSPQGRPLVASVAAPTALPELAAVTEVAAYRIAVEALLNVARHGSGASARVCVVVEGDELRVVVEDDGGPGGRWVPGVGLTGMRERAAEAGGRVSFGATETGGRVTAVLPLRA